MEEKKEKVKAEPQADLPKEKSMLDQANEAADRIEAANKKQEILIAKMEALEVEKTLGGTADAGIEEKKDENAAAKALLKGTGYEDQLFPEKTKI